MTNKSLPLAQAAEAFMQSKRRRTSSVPALNCCQLAVSTRGGKHATNCANYSEFDAHMDASEPGAPTVKELEEEVASCSVERPALPSDPAKIAKAADALLFMFAGNALFTLRSKKTQTRYTYKVQASHPTPENPETVWFVRLLSGPDNDSDYQYIGMIKRNQFRTTAKSRMTMDSLPVKAINWTLRVLIERKEFPETLEMWHEGRCGRCGRTLTVPESIERGIGPDCAGKMGL